MKRKRRIKKKREGSWGRERAGERERELQAARWSEAAERACCWLQHPLILRYKE